MSEFVIINGFDRSGTSAISRTLSSHPGMELIMQPFNSGFIRKNMYKVFSEEDESSDAFKFFRALEQNELDNSLIKSHWHFKFSSTQEFVPGKIHLIKTTINHLAQRWMKDNFPAIDVWGIWREPTDIVSSIMRNDFYGEWYEDGIVEILPTVKKEEELANTYLHFVDALQTNVQKTAFLLAVRTHFFMMHLDADKLLIFEEFNQNPAYLQIFTDYYALAKNDFAEPAKKDLNIIGQSMGANRGYDFKEEDAKFMKEIFTPIKKLKADKFQL